MMGLLCDNRFQACHGLIVSTGAIERDREIDLCLRIPRLQSGDLLQQR